MQNAPQILNSSITNDNNFVKRSLNGMAGFMKGLLGSIGMWVMLVVHLLKHLTFDWIGSLPFIEPDSYH